MSPFGEILASLLESPEAPVPREPRPSLFDDALRRFECEIARLCSTGPREDESPAPAWAIALDLRLPCTVPEVRRAFRKLAFRAHPDREGGSHGAFLRAQALLEEALVDLGRREAHRNERAPRRYPAAPLRAQGRSVGFGAYA